MRVKNSIINSIAAISSNVVTILLGLISQAIFVKTLGIEYLGLNGLFTNIISMLAIVELGIGPAIIYNLYKPIVEDDKNKIKSLLKFYKKCYRVISVVVLLIGLAIIPFLNSIVGQVNVTESIHLIFALFLIDTCASYLLSYKASILYANQKNFVISLIHIGYLIALYTLQIVILITTKNYILFLGIRIAFRILENLVITYFAHKMYPYINENDSNDLDKDTVADIVKKVKGLFFHKMGGFIVLGSDNIIISKFLGVAAVGLYSNYYLIITALNNLISQVFGSITASVGNLLIKENSEKTYEVYKKILFLNFWIYGFATTAFYYIIEPFISIWIGEAYILPSLVLITLAVNFYVQGMRKTLSTFKDAAGIYHEDRFVPIIESIINIVASILLLKVFGLAGVFMGTILSTLVVYLYSYPKYIYINLFKKSYLSYIKSLLMYALITYAGLVISYYAIHMITFGNFIVQIVYNALICLVIPNIIYALILYKTDEFKYYFRLISSILKRKAK